MTQSKPAAAVLMLACMMLSTLTWQSAMKAAVARRAATAPIDWSVAVIESTIKRNPTGESFKGWGYAKALYLYGEYLVYLRTKDKRYLDHIQSWVDQHIDEQGTINRPINSLDYIMPGN